MTSVIFVHGTGVRQPAYGHAFDTVKRALQNIRSQIHVEPCYWGDDCGVKLHAHGISVPTYSATHRGDALSDEEVESEIWQQLLADPLFELRLMAMRAATSGDELSNEESPGEALMDLARTFPVDGPLQTLLQQADLQAQFAEARQNVTNSGEFRQALQKGRDQTALLDCREATARALVAECLVLWQDTYDYPPSVDGELRDEIVAELIARLGGSERSLLSWIKERAANVVMRPVTGYVRNKRGDVTDWLSPFSGDVLLYQARGEVIRDFIEKTIQDTVRKHPGPLVLIGHSLGGIASVELLADHALPVDLLVTAGSQAPYLYEMDTLRLLPYRDNRKLPAHFPRWLNFWDRADFLSYLAGNIFRSDRQIEDIEVNNRQPFMNSHSAYWTNRQVWREIEKRLP